MLTRAALLSGSCAQVELTSGSSEVTEVTEAGQTPSSSSTLEATQPPVEGETSSSATASEATGPALENESVSSPETPPTGEQASRLC
jgi:hypothetical protein